MDDFDGNRYEGNPYRPQHEELFPEFEFSCEQSFRPDYDYDLLCEADDLDNEYDLDDVNNFGRCQQDREERFKDEEAQEQIED